MIDKSDRSDGKTAGRNFGKSDFFGPHQTSQTEGSSQSRSATGKPVIRISDAFIDHLYKGGSESRSQSKGRNHSSSKTSQKADGQEE
ncbi:MAG: hypothetical protein AAFV59_04530 [Pseudomonadota bacterium]